MPEITLKVPQDYNLKERLDKYIASNALEINRSQLKNDQTSILLNNQSVKLSTKVKANDQIQISWEETVPEDIEPQDIPLNIIYEDENVTVVNKEQGMVTHPAAGNWTGTLVNALLFHWDRDKIHQLKDGSDSEIMAQRRPGIVHRLDKDTSGVIITAKNKKSEEWLQAQFRQHNLLQKDYICICVGHPKQRKGRIETQITRSTSDRKKFKAVENTLSGKHAVTLYRVIAYWGPYTLMRVRIKTGRTHQIRVHMKYINCPVLGDSIYGRSTTGTFFDDATLMLHAYKLKIRLPGDNKHSEFLAPVPRRFKEVLRILHKNFQKS